MKKLRLLGFLMVGALLFNSCEITEPCEEDNFGSVTVNNNMTAEYQFDVTFDKDVNGDWYENENIDIIGGSSATWDNVGSGTAAVWVNTTNEGWIVAKTIELANCEDLEVSFSSQCELENAGSVTVTNKTGEYWYYDVTYGDNYTNEEVRISDNESYTWENFPEGTATVWYKDDITVYDWTIAGTVDVTACSTSSFFHNPCENNETGEAIVVNNTGFTIVVDVKNGSSGFLGERTLYDGETTTYTADANKTIAYWAQPVGGDWIHGDDYNVDICGTFTFTWTSSKLASLKSAVKPAGSITEVIDTPKKVDAPEGLNLKPQKVQR